MIKLVYGDIKIIVLGIKVCVYMWLCYSLEYKVKFFRICNMMLLVGCDKVSFSNELWCIIC